MKNKSIQIALKIGYICAKWEKKAMYLNILLNFVVGIFKILNFKN